MELNDIITIISNVGFPISMCLLLLWYIKQESDKHKEETDKLSATLEGNTKVLTELTTLIKTLLK